MRACLDNVTRHVGPEAPAWVLVEQVADGVVVTVRDDGPGIGPGRLDEARHEGRLGVSESICGRMADLGGSARLVTAPGAGHGVGAAGGPLPAVTRAGQPACWADRWADACVDTWAGW